MKKKNISYVVIIFVCCLLLNIGYAQISDELLYIRGYAVATKMDGIFISSVNITNSSNGDISSSIISSYEQTVLSSKVVLDANNSDAFLIMNVTIVNNSGEAKTFDQITNDASFYDNSNIVVETDGGLVHGQVLNDGTTVNFNLIFRYDSNYTANNSAPYNNVLNSFINIKFGIEEQPVNSHTITYENITGTNLPTNVLDGEDLVVIFDSPAPVNIHINGSSNYNYNNGTLVVYAVTNDLIISNLDNIQLPVINDGTGVINVNCPGFDSPVTLTDYLGMSFLGENLSEQTITRIEVNINYTSTIGASRTADINLVSDGNTSTQTVTFSRGTNVSRTLTFNNLDISLGEQFTINVVGNNGHSNIKINSMTVTAYYN